MEFLESISNFLNKNEETSWQKASASLDASAKIYGFRVDSVHSETFKFLGGLARNEKNNESNNEAGELDNEGGYKKDKEKRTGKHNGFNTLEKDPKKLDLTKYDLEFEVDPLFKAMTAKFSESGAKGLLLNNLPMDENLDILLESKNNNNINALCSNTPGEFTEDTQKILNDFISNMTIDELTSLQIAPDLGYFKQTRELEPRIERSFYQNFVSELDNNAIDEADEFEVEDNDNILGDNISVTSQNKSDIDSALSQQNEEPQINIPNNMSNIGGFNNITNFGGEGFSLFKHDDILEHEGQFGDGSKNVLKNLPQFQNFVKNFGQLDKNLYLHKPGAKIERTRVKKEEKLFEFSEEKEVSRGDIFGKESKYNAKKGTEVYKKENKKKVKQFYNYDKLDVFKLFCIPERSIFGSSNAEIETQINETHLLPPDDGAPFEEEEENKGERKEGLPDTTFVKFDKEYEKKFGQLYKKFDVRFVKNTIWDVFEGMEEKTSKPADFKDIVSKMSQEVDKNVLDNISTSTCFVCLLHLCNEKNLSLVQNDDKTFFVSQN